VYIYIYIDQSRPPSADVKNESIFSLIPQPSTKLQLYLRTYTKESGRGRCLSCFVAVTFLRVTPATSCFEQKRYIKVAEIAWPSRRTRNTWSTARNGVSKKPVLKCPTFYGYWKLIAVLTQAHQLGVLLLLTFPYTTLFVAVICRS
jgi:hypothetical protein